MHLKELVKAIEPIKSISGDTDFSVKGVSCDSRKTGKDFVFVAVKGVKADGSGYIQEAIRNGARAVVSNIKVPGSAADDKAVFIEVEDDRSALARLACAFYSDPSSKVRTIGVTGTNGKTTVTYLIEAILNNCGCAPGVIGTVNYRFKNKVEPSGNTTPGPLQLQCMLRRMFDSGVDYAVMEVSSHALDQARTEGIKFCAGIFTNLTQDHLDYHKDLEDYFLAKSKLFSGLPAGAVSIVNIDDPYGERLRRISKGRPVTYGIDNDCDVRARELKMDQLFSEFVLLDGTSETRIKSRLIGRHNVYNILAAFAWARAEGLDPEKTRLAIEEFSLVPGRLERVESERGFSVFVDYAHTEDALKNVLNALKQIRHNRIIVVFGCGGDRDRSKRPKMGGVVSEMADYCIITNDNPRSEEPRQIIREIRSGIKSDNFCEIPDRMEAIKRSLAIARPGDIVLVAGKGHEDYQILKDKTLRFDDREAVRQCLRSMS